MNPIRRRRLLIIVIALLGLSLATFFVLKALNENMTFFYTPSEIVEGKAPHNRPFRIGGLVVEGSVKRSDITVNFLLTDNAKEIKIVYTGILPDLFREGQGIIALGRLTEDNIFVATEVLAKHDENYMPPEVADSLQE